MQQHGYAIFNDAVIKDADGSINQLLRTNPPVLFPIYSDDDIQTHNSFTNEKGQRKSIASKRNPSKTIVQCIIHQYTYLYEVEVADN